MDWPADVVERRPISGLVPYAKNARVHSDAQVAEIAASIREWGWTVPVLVDEAGGIIAGHGRVLAAQSLGIDEVPVMVAAGWTDAQKRAYVLADNKLAENAAWDADLLRVELLDLHAVGFPLASAGFTAEELARLTVDRTAGMTDPDEAPEAPAVPVSQQGDLWQIGRHRVICGDSTQVAVVERLLAGAAPHLMVTDPPYGVEYDADWRNRADRANGKPCGARAVGLVQNDERADWRETWALFPGDVVYAWHGFQQCPVLANELIDAGFNLRALIAWVKNSAPISRGNYHHQHETCWYAVRKSGTGHWSGDRTQTTVWEIDRLQKSETGHSTQKPVEAMRRPIVNNSAPDDAVYDPFLGSGTTLIAAEMEGRICYGCELFPAYVDVIVRRWQEFTGREVTLEGDGRAFDEIASLRSRESA